MRPWQHALSSIRGTERHWTRDLDIHEFMDSTKGASADRRHRFALHSADLGSEIVERAFSDRPEARTVALKHVEEDLGYHCPLADWLALVNLSDWPRPLSRRLDASRTEIIEMVLARNGRNIELEIGSVYDFLMLPLQYSGNHQLAGYGVLMNSFGLTLTRRVFGPPIELADSRAIVDFGAIAESIIFAMFGRIPCFGEMTGNIVREPGAKHDVE